MVFNQTALALCLLLLLGTRAAAFAAARRGDKRQVRVLQFFRMGLGLSGASYLIRLLGAPPAGPISFLSFICCFCGTLLIWVGWMEHWTLYRERSRALSALKSQEEDDGATSDAPPPAAGLPRLNSRAQRLLRHAQEEARSQRQGCVDTDHLLLGLLREPSGAGVDILDRLCVKQASLHLALGQPVSPGRPESPPAASDQSTGVEPLPLTDRACQALTLAAQEAHRFDKTSVGTDHLLLGLVLMGRGAAASALFSEGVTVEGIRGEVMKSRACR